ncbi:hypothetical protein OG292_20925 [Streptomyces sp. NBC_01511]|uniref:hypothetical protein n=1 Tax=Streptomyces sp. NBC_01511 TaxID=2903889 RepID=UPI00386664D5
MPDRQGRNPRERGDGDGAAGAAPDDPHPHPEPDAAPVPGSDPASEPTADPTSDLTADENGAASRRRRAQFLRELNEAKALRERVKPRQARAARMRQQMRMRTFRW